jgi:hypothetical protein
MGVFGDLRHSFEAEITIRPLGPETRKTHPFNGIRWDFCRVEYLDERGWADPRSVFMSDERDSPAVRAENTFRERGGNPFRRTSPGGSRRRF